MYGLKLLPLLCSSRTTQDKSFDSYQDFQESPNTAMAAEQKFHELTKHAGHIAESEIATVFDALKPVTPNFMIGSWKGSSFDTGHATHQQLAHFKWAGKDFRSSEDVDPIMVYKEDGSRVCFEEYGHARLREVKFRGVVSTAMIYDKFPVIDSFRLVSDTVVIGAMDNKEMADAGTYYFYLTRT